MYEHGAFSHLIALFTCPHSLILFLNFTCKPHTCVCWMVKESAYTLHLTGKYINFVWSIKQPSHGNADSKPLIRPPRVSSKTIPLPPSMPGKKALIDIKERKGNTEKLTLYEAIDYLDVSVYTILFLYKLTTCKR